MARTKYQSLVSAVSSFCKGKGSKKTVNDRKKAYIDHAVKKGGKTKTEATKIANKVVNKPCPKTAKPKAKKSKTTRRRRRA